MVDVAHAAHALVPRVAQSFLTDKLQYPIKPKRDWSFDVHLFLSRLDRPFF